MIYQHLCQQCSVIILTFMALKTVDLYVFILQIYACVCVCPYTFLLYSCFEHLSHFFDDRQMFISIFARNNPLVYSQTVHNKKNGYAQCTCTAQHTHTVCHTQRESNNFIGRTFLDFCNKQHYTLSNIMFLRCYSMSHKTQANIA